MTVAVFLLVWMGYMLSRWHGQYDPSAGLAALVFFGGLTALSIRPPAWLSAALLDPPERIAAPLLAFAQLLFWFWTWQSPNILYSRPGWALEGFQTLLLIGLIASVALAATTPARPAYKLAVSLSAATFLVALAAQLLVPLLSPAPHIDVHVTNTLAVDFLFSGKNPYGQTYPDIYRGALPYQPAFFYFPGILLWLAPARLLFGEIRYGLIAANVATAAALFFLTRRRVASGSLLPWLVSSLWMAFPVNLFIVEQAWIDPALIATGAWLLISLERTGPRRWILAGLLAGLACTIKQYGFLFAAFGCLAAWARYGRRVALRMAALTTAVTAAIILPFALNDWSGFVTMTIRAHTEQPIRMDAYNFTVFVARELGQTAPSWLRAAFSLIGVAAGIAVFRRRSAAALSGVAPLALGLLWSYGAIFWFGKAAFCNYHALLAALLALHLAARSPDDQLPSAR